MTDDMIDSDEFKAAVSRAGGIDRAAALIEFSTASVKRWQHKGVPANREGMVRQKLGRLLPSQDGPEQAELGVYSDAELLLEIARRLGGRGGTKVTRSPETPDEPSSPVYDVNDPPTRGTRYGTSGPPGRRSGEAHPQE